MTTTPWWPDWLQDIWAKSPERGPGYQGQSLAEHTWRTLQRLADLINLRPDLPAEVGCPWLWNTLFWACWLHDFGKAARGFQGMLRGRGRWPHRHEVLSLAFVDWLSEALTGEERTWVVAAIVSHHRDAAEIQKLYSDPDDEEDEALQPRLAEIDDAAIAGLRRWVQECCSSWIEALGLADVGIRVATLAAEAQAVREFRESSAARARHWLQVYRQRVRALAKTDSAPLVIGTLALRGHVISADHQASADTGELPEPRVASWPELVERLGMSWETLYDHQRACAEVRGSVVLAAPTGSGKTEAALIWACGQSDQERRVPRLFYVLPFQASMNAMYDRLRGKPFPDQVGLEHSRSTLALYRRLLDSEPSPELAARRARWEHNLARLSYYPVRVLSPYQILKAPYRLRGYEALLTDCFGAAFVLDEIHAYEPERLAKILATVRYLREQFGARFLVMSATLPRVLNARLAETLGGAVEIQASQALFARFRRHRLRVLLGELLSEESLDRITRAAIAGRSVLVCCNTVARVQEVYEAIRTRVRWIPVVLLHGRFNGRDRLAKEELVRKATGATSEVRRPIILVATQVVEVSLDIDLDTIFTDPAPLEALIQRFGRVNRRHRRKWCTVHVFAEPADGQGVYDEQLVRRGLHVLSRANGKLIDEAHVTDWLDEVYQGEVAAKWEAEYDAAYREFVGGCLTPLRAFDSNDDLEGAFYRAFDSIEVLPSCLRDEFEHLKEEDPLATQELLVPLRWGQFAELQRKGLAQLGRDGRPSVVEAPYDSDRGLRLKG